MDGSDADPRGRKRVNLGRDERCPVRLRIVSDHDMISKIRARLSTRNRELYTGQWADTRSSRVREQQVVHQKVPQSTRPPLRNRYHG